MTLRQTFGVGALITVLLLSTHVLAQEPVPSVPAGAGTQNDPVRLNVSVDLVNVAATVRDSTGQYLDGLTAQDFTVLENGVAQKLSFFNPDCRLALMISLSPSGLPL